MSIGTCNEQPRLGLYCSCQTTPALTIVMVMDITRPARHENEPLDAYIHL